MLGGHFIEGATVGEGEEGGSGRGRKGAAQIGNGGGGDEEGQPGVGAEMLEGVVRGRNAQGSEHQGVSFGGAGGFWVRLLAANRGGVAVLTVRAYARAVERDARGVDSAGRGGVGRGDEREEELFVGPFTRRRGSRKTKKAEKGRCSGRGRRGDLGGICRCGLGSRGQRGRGSRGRRMFGCRGGSGFGFRGGEGCQCGELRDWRWGRGGG